MNIVESSKSYESWLARQVVLQRDDLDLKHQRMSETPFQFLRATFYRWVQLWLQHAPKELRKAPEILAVGDLHLENFGTWRDLDGRLIWGINDFDEAFPQPYAIDLVRLGTSLLFAIEARELKLSLKDALHALLDGYGYGLESGGRPFVLEEHHSELRAMAINDLRDPVAFWKKLSDLPKRPGQGPWQNVLKAAMPELDSVSFRRRTAGLGSLGRPRIVALADFGGGLVAREAKALAPSAWAWALDRKTKATYAPKLVEAAVRVRDPFWRIHSGWIVRRLAPHCCKIDVQHWPKKRKELELVWAMGFETANVHLGQRHLKRVSRDFKGAQLRRIRAAIEDMADRTMKDWKEWREASL